MTHVSAHQYLNDGDLSPGSAAAPIPAINGGAPAFSRGWGIALITVEPAHQAAAIDWMVQLMIPETNAALNRATNYLPTRQAALVHWDQGGSYTPFAHQQLQTIQPLPTIPNYAVIAGVLQDAVEDVLSGSATPEEAASQAIERAQ
jgi:maltose-binding protein MalE